jgi:archaellum biogenesis protein FlaJ (TadC family)
MKSSARIAEIILFIILGASLILTLLMMFGGKVPGDANNTPLYTDTILRFAYLLVIASVATAVVFEIVNSILHPRNSKKTVLTSVAVSLVLLVGFSFADSTPLTLIGYSGSDNVPSMLIITDTGLYAFYFLMVIAILVIVGTEVYRIFK